MLDVIGFIGVTIAAIVVGTFAEYFVHRAMHWGLLYGEGHRWHHESNEARTFARDVYDYGGGAAALGWIGFLVSSSSGFAWMLARSPTQCLPRTRTRSSTPIPASCSG